MASLLLGFNSSRYCGCSTCLKGSSQCAREATETFPARHLLAGQFVHVQSHGTFLVTLLVVLRHVHVALSVARVVGHPHRHRSARNRQLSQQRDTVGWDGQEKDKSLEEGSERIKLKIPVRNMYPQLKVRGQTPNSLTI